MNERLIDFFVRCHKLGWHLTPCAKDKSPTLLGLGGWYNASQNSSAWMAWARTHHQCLWGVRPTEGFCVLDADVKHDGVKLLDELIAKHGALPKTPSVRTGGGGRHYYFSCD